MYTVHIAKTFFFLAEKSERGKEREDVWEEKRNEKKMRGGREE